MRLWAISPNPDRKSTRLNSSHTVIYTLSLHDALPICMSHSPDPAVIIAQIKEKLGIGEDKVYAVMGDFTEPRSEEHTSELQSHSDLHSFPTRRSSDLYEPQSRSRRYHRSDQREAGHR